ncbi:Histone deacetylase complex subunit [Malassezia brasiliensis]|uniref:Histone deacetylase complex subunit n=1 Tax=Malassezia brasiliensis TaxID=1821822 RepID=A0AAF0ITM0_9BASI|nr:Histone deacetylase complex subunit [Malassezia brasiliensis]
MDAAAEDERAAGRPAGAEERGDDVPATPRRSRRTHTEEPEAADDDARAARADADTDDDDDTGTDEGVTRCVCGSTDENVGLMIQCETCKCWQHCACMGMHTEDDCPDVYYCEQCKPENHIELLRSLGFLPSPKAAKRGTATRPPRGTYTARELKDAKDAIRAMALDNAARLRDDAEHASPAPRRTRAASPPRRAPSESAAPKRRSTMNSREIGENGWESIPAELLVADDDRAPSDEPDEAQRKRKRSPRETAPPDDTPHGSPADKRRRTQPDGAAHATPQPEPKRERPSSAAREEGKPKHPNQYTYRNGAAPPTKRDARRAREPGTRPGTPQVEAPAKGGTGALPEHLQHLAYLLPPFVGEDDEGEAPRPEPAGPRAGLPEPFALTVAIDTATKIRYPQKRMTLGEMRKRVRNLGEYVTRVQIEAVERAKRVDLLRTVRAEAAPAEQGLPLSMQLVEQLTADLTAFQRRFMQTGREEAEDAA